MRFERADELGHPGLQVSAPQLGENNIPVCIPTSSPIQIMSTPISTSFFAAVRWYW